MNEEDSPSAVNAMKALQTRIDQLQNENEMYKRDISVLRLNLSDFTMKRNEEEAYINEKAALLSKKLAGSAEIIRNIRILRREKIKLQNIYDEIQKELGKQLRTNIETKKKIAIASSKLQEISETQRSLDEILIHYVIPPPSKVACRGNFTFNTHTKTEMLNLQSSKIQTLIKQLQSLPTSILHESFDNKRRIFDTLKAAKERIETLELEIADTETRGGSAKGRAAQIKQKELQISLIQQNLTRFRSEFL